MHSTRLESSQLAIYLFEAVWTDIKRILQHGEIYLLNSFTLNLKKES